MDHANGISCNDFKESIGDWIEGLPAGQPRDGFEAHLASCEGCQAALARERQFFSLLSGLERESAPAGFAARSLAAILPEVAPAPSRRALWSQPRWAGQLMMAAALVLMIGVLGQWFGVGGEAARPEAIRETATLALVEGSRNVPTAISFFERTGKRVQEIAGATWVKMQSMLRAERTLRNLIPPGAFALFILVCLTPLVLLFTVYHLRIKGALSHVLVIPSLR